MKKLGTAFVIGLLVASSSFAQEDVQEEVQIIESADIVVHTDEGGQEGEVVEMQVIAADDLGGAPAVFMSRSGNGGNTFSTFSLPSVGGGFLSGHPVDSFSLLHNPSVQKDLELVDEQMDKIRAIQSDFGKRISEQVREMSKNGFKSESAASLKDVIKKLKDEQKAAVQDILLDHQQQRLKQVALQMNMKNRGAENALASKEIAEELGLTEDQIENLKKKAKELKKSVEEKIKRIREEAKAELLNELSSDQQTKLKEMTGDTFKSDTKDFQSRFRPRRIRQKN